MDEITSRRSTIGIIAKEKYGINFFSKEIDESQYVRWNEKYETPLILDSFYMHCLISYGVIYIIIISYAIFKTSKNSNMIDKMYIIIFSILGITEMTCYDVVLCITLLLFSDVIQVIIFISFLILLFNKLSETNNNVIHKTTS